MAHVHGIGDTRPGRRYLFIPSGSQITGKFIIRVRGHDELSHRQPHAPRVLAAEGIAEIARWNGKYNLFPLPRKHRIGIDIVDDLRHDPAEVDGIRRGEVEG